MVAGVVVTGETGAAGSGARARAARPSSTSRSAAEAPREGERLLQARLREAGYFDAEIDGEWVQSGDEAGRPALHRHGRDAHGDRVRRQRIAQRRAAARADGSTHAPDRHRRDLARVGAAHPASVPGRRLLPRQGEGEDRRRRSATRHLHDRARDAPTRCAACASSATSRSATPQLRDEMNTQPRRLLPWPRSGRVRPRGVRRGSAPSLVLLSRAGLRRRRDRRRADRGRRRHRRDRRHGGDRRRAAHHRRGGAAAGSERAAAGAAGARAAAWRRTNRCCPRRSTPTREAIRRALRSDGYTDATVEPVVTQRTGGSGGAGRRRLEDRTRAAPDRSGRWSCRATSRRATRSSCASCRSAPAIRSIPKLLRRGQDQVYQLGTYRSVAVQPLEPAAPVQDVGVEVVPRPPGSIQWGVGYNTRDGITGFGEIGYDNIGARARRSRCAALGSVLPDDPSQTQFLAVLGLSRSAVPAHALAVDERADRRALDPDHRPVQRPARQLRQRLRARRCCRASRPAASCSSSAPTSST